MPTYYGGTPSPPDTRSLPANGQPLTIVNEASVGQATYSGGGGGGGGGGANPSVSTLTVASGGNSFIKLNNGDSTSLNATLLFPFDSANTNQIEIGVEQFTSTLSVLYGTGYGTLQMNQLVLNSQTQGVAAPGCSLQTSQFGDLIVNMPPGASIRADDRNLMISTINGAPPGGGTSTPNPVFSSITLSTTGAINTDNSMIINLNGVGGTLSVDNIGTGGVTDIVMGTNASAASVYPGWPTGSANYLNVNSPSGLSGMVIGVSDENGAVISMAVNNAGVLSTFTFNSQGNLNFLAPLTSISSLNVSSINGAAPGGGAAAANPSTFSTLVGLSSINSGAPAPLTVVGELTVTNTIGCSALSTISITSVVPNGNVIVPLIQSSNLNVSSINNAVYPPAGGGGVFSTLYETSSTIVCNPGGTTQLLGFPCVNGKGYNVSWQVGVTGFAAQTINAGENILGLLSVDGGATSIAGNVTLAAVSTNSALGFDSLQLGGCLNFKGGTNSNVFLEVYNATNSTITVTLGESYLVTY